MRLSCAALRTIDKNGIDAVWRSYALAAKAFKGLRNGKRRTRENQTGIHCWNRSLLYYRQEQRTMPEKMLIKKFDPVARKHVDYKEQN